MKLTKMGTDYIRINEDTEYDVLLKISRVHIIKLDFFNPTEEKVRTVMELFPKTNRFVVEDNIKIYNYILKRTSKKFYVQNKPGVGFISFFRKNNKVLLNMTRLYDNEKQFILHSCLPDILKNIEVILLDQKDYDANMDVFKSWNGNVIIAESQYLL